MDKLIEALQIFLKYGNPSHPCCAYYEELKVFGYQDIKILNTDRKRLEELGFYEYDGHWAIVLK